MQTFKKGLTLVSVVAIAASSFAALKGDVPAGLAGKWRWSKLSNTTYVDRSNGAYMGNGGGMSDTYEFAKDGTYKETCYIEMSPSAGWTTKCFISMEGKVEIDGETMNLVVTKGHFHTEDNRVARSNMDRDMTDKEMKERSKSHTFSMDKDGGKSRLVFHLSKGELMKFELVK